MRGDEKRNEKRGKESFKGKNYWRLREWENERMRDEKRDEKRDKNLVKEYIVWREYWYREKKRYYL